MLLLFLLRHSLNSGDNRNWRTWIRLLKTSGQPLSHGDQDKETSALTELSRFRLV
jgi:hypothetical protein